VNGRLTYSSAGLIRSMQVTRAKLHVFVEGRDLDSYVYGRICEAVMPGIFTHRITRADELSPASTGGKEVLLAHFKRFRRQNKLVIDFKGAKSATLFFLDKDLDDLSRRKKRSGHVVYTRSYDLEAEVFREGDLVDAVAALCSLSPTAVRHKFAPTDWRKQSLDAWRPWVEFCVLSKTNPALGLPSYGNVSLMHDSGDLALNPAKQARLATKLTTASVAAAVSLLALEDLAKRRVARSYAATGGYEVFKGKWFPETVVALAKTHFPIEAGRVTAFKSHLASHVAQTLPMRAPWVLHYSQPIRALLAIL